MFQVDKVIKLREKFPIQAWWDSWALVHWILVDICDVYTFWIETAMTRDSPTLMQGYGVNVCKYTLNRRVIQRIHRGHILSIDDKMEVVSECRISPVDTVYAAYDSDKAYLL